MQALREQVKEGGTKTDTFFFATGKSKKDLNWNLALSSHYWKENNYKENLNLMPYFCAITETLSISLNIFPLGIRQRFSKATLGAYRG